MRVRLSLCIDGTTQCLPINYNYPLAAKIYQILSNSSPEYSRFLHDNGYLGADGKLRKLFTFSRLDITPRAGRTKDILVVDNRHKISLVIASPMNDDFIQHFVVGLFNQQHFVVANHKTRGLLHVEQVEVCPEPEFRSGMTFRALSPIVLKTVVERNGDLSTHYLRPYENEVSETVRRSLLKKFETITGRPPDDDQLHCSFDKNYLSRYSDPERVMCLVKLREGRHDQTNVKGFLAPFTLSGSVDLMRTAWHAGLGDKCSMGFGCVGEAD